jgi:hypothetical protein
VDRAPAAEGVSRRRRVGRRRGGALQQLRTSLLQILKHRQLELLRIRHPLEAGHLRGEFQRLGNQSLIFAIEENTDLTERFKILLFTQLHHASNI